MTGFLVVRDGMIEMKLHDKERIYHREYIVPV